VRQRHGQGIKALHGIRIIIVDKQSVCTGGVLGSPGRGIGLERVTVEPLNGRHGEDERLRGDTFDDGKGIVISLINKDLAS
jgi:hypothetical protein